MNVYNVTHLSQPTTSSTVGKRPWQTQAFVYHQAEDVLNVCFQRRILFNVGVIIGADFW